MPTCDTSSYIRHITIFFIVLSFALYMRVTSPTSYFDNMNFDYNSVSISHAILFAERAAGTPNSGNLNINSHPGIPFYLSMGLTRTLLGEGTAQSPADRIVYLFSNIEKFWNIQAVLGGVLAAVGAVLLSLYCRHVPLVFLLTLFALPLVYLNATYCAPYIYDITNETFALPFIALFFLTMRAIFTSSSDKRTTLLFVVLGIVACMNYSIKLPYIAVFFSGCMVVLFSAWQKPHRLKAIITYSTAYIVGFLFVLLCIATCLGKDCLVQFLHFHYNVLTHTGFAGDGSEGVADAGTVFKNIRNLVYYFYRLWPVYLFALGVVIGSRLLKTGVTYNIQRISCIIVVIGLFTLAVLKHWSEHYALILPIASVFLLYEILSPTCRISKKYSFFISAVLAVLILTSVFPSYTNFTTRIAKLNVTQAEKAQFVQQIHALPLQEREVIYYLWGSHFLPIFSIQHPLGLTYLNDPAIIAEAFRKLVPEQTIFTNFPYIHTKDKPTIRYIVANIDTIQKVPRGEPIIPWDNPAPRLSYALEDRIVLQYGNIAVIEKAQPISPAK